VKRQKRSNILVTEAEKETTTRKLHNIFTESEGNGVKRG